MKRELIIYLMGRLIPATVSLAVIVLAIRFLGPAEYGRYSLLLYTALLAITLSFHWVQVSILKFLGGMLRETNVVMSRFYDLTILSAIFSTIVVVLAGLFYFRLSWIEMVLVALFTFLNHFYLFHQAILQAYHRSIRTAILEGTDQVLIIMALLAGLFLFNLRSSVLLFGALVIGLIGVLILRSLIRVKGLLTVDLTHIYWDSRFSGKVVEFGYGIALWLFFSHLMMAADRFIVMERFGYHDAGIYSGIKDLFYKAVTFASFPLYMSYQTKVADQWNSKHRRETWATIREALSFEILIFIIVFIMFMVFKPVLFKEVLKVPQMDHWLIYLPVLLAAFLWQFALLLHRYLELAFRSGIMLVALAVTVAANIVLNLLFVTWHNFIASGLILLITTALYTGFMFIMAFIAGRRLNVE